MGSDEKILLYVAIDFGTTFSGYAFRFKNQPDIQVCSKLGGASLGFESYKVPTCVLTDSDDNFVAFGYEAQDKYSEDDSDDEGDGDDRKPKFHFYDEFKMKLAGEKRLDKYFKLEAYDGHECLAITIFAMVLDHLKKHLLTEIGKIVQTKPQDEEIKWILTVPAIWSDSAKQFMRESAIEAGIVSKSTEEQLLIALEPEAASLYCRTLNVKDFNLKENISDSTLAKGLPENTHYMVVDCGGGTVDVTAHHYKKGGDICELYAASGGGWGGTNINNAFESKLKIVLGETFMNKFKTKYPLPYLTSKIDFEKKKRSIDFSKAYTKFPYSCPHAFKQICEQIHGEGVNLAGIVKKASGVGFTAGTITFDKTNLLEVFQPSICLIKNHILQLVDKPELKDLEFIYLVGGFSDCALLQSEIKNEFTQGSRKDKKIHVVLAPTEASLAVVKGAVLFGSKPDAISSRCARRFYCTSSGGSRSRKHLTTIVKQNEEIYNDDVRHTHFIPSNGDNIFRLYHYKIKDLTESKSSVRDIDVRDIEVIDIDVSNILQGSQGTGDKVSVYIYFGSTEIHVTARNDTNPGMKPVTQSIDCLKH